MSANVEPMIVDEGEEDSSSDSDDDKELICKAEELEKKISSNKYLYDAHVEIVDIYHKIGDLNSMREAYKRFHECFPLTTKLWLDWLRVEMKIANTPEEQKRLFSLFDKAVEDYLSVELWIEYAQYSIGVSDLKTSRSILERGLTAAGLHVSEGFLLWDTLRELEHAHISLHEPDSEEWKCQVNKLADVFKRQLSVPLLNIEDTYHEWQEWFETLPDGVVDPKPIEWGYKKAVQTLEIYKPFEEKLLVTENNELYQVYKDYLKVVQDPSAALCLYERAVLSLCLVPSVWVDYCMFCFKLGDIAIKVSSRALRNCPWSEELWITKLRILESQNVDDKEVLACFEQGLNSITNGSCLELWLCYLEYFRRKGSRDVDKIDKLFSQAIQQLGIENDPLCKLSRWHARILAERGDMALARKIWSNILSYQANKGSAAVWLEFANLERQYGNKTHLRTIFKKAILACKDWPQYISEEWLMFEREFGTLEDVLKCLETCRDLITVESQPAREYENKPEVSELDTDKSNYHKGKKRRYEQRDRLHDNKTRTFNPRNDMHQERRELPSPVVNKHIDKNPKTTVFVSNLHPGVSEQTLKELFPNATIIDLVLDRKGKSRCYGYIQFAKEEEAMTALARDRTPIDGRPMFISELKSEKTERKPVFKYAPATETNKLFVRGLPLSKTKEEVEEIFKPYKPVDVRLVLKKNGQAKGIAYIEFENDEAAQKALTETDQMKIDDHVLSVAISAPPPKKAPGAKVEEPIRHARSRLQLPMIPRSLQVKSSETKAGIVDSKTSAIPKSNADFRNMLLKK